MNFKENLAQLKTELLNCRGQGKILRIKHKKKRMRNTQKKEECKRPGNNC